MAKFLRNIFVILALVGTPLAQAQIYKCVDASGKTVYSQSPCPANAKSSNLRPAAPAPAPAASKQADAKAPGKSDAKSSGPKTAAELDQEFRKRRADQEEAKKKEQERLAQAKAKEDSCRSAREQLASLESGIRQIRVNEKGERVYLDDAQIAKEKDRARQAAQNACK